MQSIAAHAPHVNQSRHLQVDLGEVAGVGRGEAAHKCNQCAELRKRHTWNPPRHLLFDLGEVAGVGLVKAAHKFNQCAE